MNNFRKNAGFSMRTLSFILLFFVSSIQNLVAQSEKIVGTYELNFGNDDAFFERKITLNADGSFFYHLYRNIKQGIPPEENKYGKGHWRIDKKRIYFIADKSDLDEKHTLNFNTSKARFDSKSPRDKSDRIVKTSIRFYESEIPWLKGNTMLKVE